MLFYKLLALQLQFSTHSWNCSDFQFNLIQIYGYIFCVECYTVQYNFMSTSLELEDLISNSDLDIYLLYDFKNLESQFPYLRNMDNNVHL